jgi:hypothetical protein
LDLLLCGLVLLLRGDHVLLGLLLSQLVLLVVLLPL